MEPPVDSSIDPHDYHQFFDVCYFCREYGSSAQPLKRCGGCQLVAYCSRDCQKDDRYYHKRVCKEFPVVNGKNVLHTTGSWKEHIVMLEIRAQQLPDNFCPPIFSNPRVCNTCREAQPERLTDCKCAGVCYCSKVCTDADKSHKDDCSYLSYLARTHYENVMIMSYPMSLKYALETVPKHSFGRDFIPIEDRTTLSVHVVSSRHIFEAPWELALLHKLPELKQLKLDFIMQKKMAKAPIEYNDSKICEDCEANDRIITSSIHQMPYHTFFSSPKYTEPDVVVIYGNKQEMLENDDDGNIHTGTAYRNMINSQDTVLVLTDTKEDLLREGNMIVNNAQPIYQLSVPQINKLRGCGSLGESGSSHAKLASGEAVFNEKYYFTCLQKQDPTNPISKFILEKITQ